MRLVSSLSLALLLASVAGDARAILLRGAAEGVVREGYLTVSGDAPPAFALDPDSLAGVHTSVRFAIDLDLLPPDGDPGELAARYSAPTSGPPEWLAMEIEINGVTRKIGAGERALGSYEGSGPGEPGDELRLVADRIEDGGTPEWLSLDLQVDDFGVGGEIPLALDLTSGIHEFRSTYILSQSRTDPISGATSGRSDLHLYFSLDSFTLAVPEPSALALLALGALTLLGRRAGGGGAPTTH